jgi:hypothetical protein
MIFAYAYIRSCVPARSALAHKDITGKHTLASELLDAKTLAV